MVGMRMPSRWSFPALALAAGLATILVVLAVLQYEWSGQVSDAQRERMQVGLSPGVRQTVKTLFAVRWN